METGKMGHRETSGKQTAWENANERLAIRLARLPCNQSGSNWTKSTDGSDIGAISWGLPAAVPRFFSEPRALCALGRVEIPVISCLPHTVRFGQPME
jgi:hypothetical protein